MKYLLDLYPEGISAMDFFGSMPIHVAVEHNRLEVVKFLVDKDPDMVKAEYRYGYEVWKLPAHVAATHGHLEVFKYLHTVYPEGSVAMNEDGDLPIHRAAIRGNIRILPTTREI